MRSVPNSIQPIQMTCLLHCLSKQPQSQTVPQPASEYSQSAKNVKMQGCFIQLNHRQAAMQAHHANVDLHLP